MRVFRGRGVKARLLATLALLAIVAFGFARAHVHVEHGARPSHCGWCVAASTTVAATAPVTLPSVVAIELPIVVEAPARPAVTGGPRLAARGPPRVPAFG